MIFNAAVKLQRALDLLSSWMSEWRLTLNVTKTQAIFCLVTNLGRLPCCTSLANRSCGRYIGVTIDKTLHMTDQVKKAANAAKNCFYGTTACLPLRTRLDPYNAHVTSHLTYWRT